MSNQEAKSMSGKETYNTVAETVGLLPSLRLKDNVIQGIVVVVMTAIATLIGLIWHGTMGAAVGALHGRAGIPERWIEGLSGRTREDDEGRVFELITATQKEDHPSA